MMQRTMRATAWLGLAIACGVSTMAVVPAAEGPPQSAAEAVAIATKLAKAAGPGGQAVCASQADQLAIIPAEWIVPCLAAFADATPAGANWLRSGLERAVDKAGAGLSADSLAAVVAAWISFGIMRLRSNYHAKRDGRRITDRMRHA